METVFETPHLAKKQKRFFMKNFPRTTWRDVNKLGAFCKPVHNEHPFEMGELKNERLARCA